MADEQQVYGEFASVYDDLMATMPYDKWITFVHNAWEKYGRPKKVVDLGCGTGNLLLPLIQSGYQVSGIDISSDMLAIAHQKILQTSKGRSLLHAHRVQLIQQDMRHWQLPQTVDCVFSFCDCLNYLLDEDDVYQTFVRTFHGLNDGGIFMFDMHHVNQFRLYNQAQPFVLTDPTIAYIWMSEWDESSKLIAHDLTIFAQTGAMYRRIEESHVQRVYDQTWIEAQLKAIGFSQVNCFGDFSWEAPKADVNRLFLSQ